MTSLPTPTAYLSRTSRADKLADDMHGLALQVQAKEFHPSHAQRYAVLRAASMLAFSLLGSEWKDTPHFGDISWTCEVFMCELCQTDSCTCFHHMPDGSEPDQLEAA